MPKLAQNVTTEDLLASLKNYLKVNLQTSQRLVSTVKTGLVDTRDELPMCMVLPVSEVVTRMYNNGLFAVDRLFRIDIVDKAYSVEEVKANLKLAQETANIPLPQLMGEEPTKKSNLTKYLLFGVGGLVLVITTVVLLRRN